MIENHINDIRYSFERDTGKVVTKLYLGWETYRDLFRKLDRIATVKINVVYGIRAQYMGMDVYQVDEKTYIGVGI